jgi:MMP 1-O-methyltransferase
MAGAERTNGLLGSLRGRARETHLFRRFVQPPWYHYRFGAEMGSVLTASYRAAGFADWGGRIGLYRAAAALPPGATVLEIGSFLGASTILLAGALRHSGGGVVHAVDPFDGRGDAFAASVFAEIAAQDPRPLADRFEANVERAGLRDLVRVHPTTAEELAEWWTEPVDLLLLDGDYSPAGARRAFELIEPHLAPGGVLALHGTADRDYEPDHDGNYRLRTERLMAPRFGATFTVEGTTIARKLA